MTASRARHGDGGDGSGQTPFRRVGIIGCGLIGGSLALAARGFAGVERIVVTDRDPEVRGAVARRRLADVVAKPQAVAADADVVFIAVPLEDITKVAATVWPMMAPGAVLTDVGSVKSKVMAEVESLMGNSGHLGPAFVGGHPMAGSEREGLDGADGTIFQGAAYVLTPSASAPTEAFNRLASFVRLLGSRVIAVDAETHDRLVGIVSHLPQVLASSLMTFAADTARADPGLLAMAGGGFRDVTRVAASSPDLWTGILRENREAVLDALQGFAGVLAALRTALAVGDWPALRDALAAGRAARALLPGKVVDAPLIDVVIPVQDRPGSLAAVTTALGAVGINIEDVSMRHAEDSPRGALVVAVAGEDTAERARQALAARGFPSHLETR